MDLDLISAMVEHIKSFQLEEMSIEEFEAWLDTNGTPSEDNLLAMLPYCNPEQEKLVYKRLDTLNEPRPARPPVRRSA